MTSSKFGYIQEPRFRSTPDGLVDQLAQNKKFYELSPHLVRQTTGPVDLSQYCVAMDQYTLPSCVGNGTCEALEILESIAHEGIVGYQPTLLSRMFIWAMARTEEGTLSQVIGTHVRTAFNVLSTLGVCTEVLWPYDASLATESPSILAQRQALGHTIQGAYAITSTGDQIIQDIITSLQAYHPVVFATVVTNAFENLTGNGPVSIPGPNDPLAGGHCMVVVGWDGSNFIVKNSWGTAWGANGFCLFTPDYFTWVNTTELWVPTLGPAAFSMRRQK